MKLKNKKTGEIGEFFCSGDPCIGEITLGVEFENEETVKYSSLSKMAEEWEDYEEPKEYWFINDLDGKPMKCELRYCPVRDFTDWIEKRKQIGNYFETKEDAEKAVEKLKAWKRLKDKEFKFIGETCEYKDEKHFGSVFFETSGYLLDIYEDTCEFYDDLDLIFGDEE